MTRTPDSSYSKKYLTQKFFKSQKTRSPKNVSKIRKFALISELPVAFNLDIPYNLVLGHPTVSKVQSSYMDGLDTEPSDSDINKNRISVLSL